MPLKRRFYEVIQNKLNTEQNLYLPLFKHEYKYEYLDELFHVYYLSVIKGIKNKNSEFGIERAKAKIVFNILKNLEGNTLYIKHKHSVEFRQLFGSDENLILQRYNNLKEDINNGSMSLEDFTKKYESKYFMYVYRIFLSKSYIKNFLYEYLNFIYYILYIKIA